MIHSVYILKSDGIPLFSGCYNEEIDQNLDLVAGLLSAIFLFAHEVGEGIISSVVLENKKYVYSQSEGLIFVVCTNDTDDVSTKRVIGQIQTEFIKQYKRIIEQGLTTKRSIFPNFSITLDNLLGQSIAVSSVTDKSAFTNLERLDKLFETYIKQKLGFDQFYEEKFKRYLKKKAGY